MTRSFWHALTVVLTVSLFPAEASRPAEAPLIEPHAGPVDSPVSCASDNFVVGAFASFGSCDDIDCCGGAPEAPCAKLRN